MEADDLFVYLFIYYRGILLSRKQNQCPCFKELRILLLIFWFDFCSRLSNCCSGLWLYSTITLFLEQQWEDD